MIFGQKPLFDFQDKKGTKHLVLPPTVKNETSLEALLEEPAEKKVERNPLEWVGASAVHILIIAVLIIVPLYTTGTIQLMQHEEIPLVAPPPPPPPPPAVVAAAPVASHEAHPSAQVILHTRKLVAPVSIPKKVGQEQLGGALPELGGVAGGVPGGVAGGQLGGVANGVAGAAGNAPPPPPPPAEKPLPKKRLVRAGSNLKPPRRIYSVNPEYPALARQAHVFGVVDIDAVIDEQGNIVQARALNGHPLLISAAINAVLQWKYEPTVLNGEPTSVELVVHVNFDPR